MSSSARDHDLTTCAATAQEPLREAFAELARVASVARHISWATADGGGMIDPADLRLLLAELGRLNERNVEVSLLAHSWMVAHDMRAAGKPYNYPSTADKPRLLADNERLRGAIQAAMDDLENKNGLNDNPLIDVVWHTQIETTWEMLASALMGEG